MTDAALEIIENLLTIIDHEVELIEVLSKAITGTASGKALGSNGIPADLFRQCKSNVGEKERCHKTCVTLRLLHYIKTRVPDRILITTG